MKLGKLVRRKPITVREDATIHDVIRIMAEQNIGFLVVVEGSNYVGVLSERDVIRSLAEEKNLDKTVGSFCKRDIIKLSADKTVEDAAQVMGKHRIRHVVVVDEKDNLVGVVSARDVLEELYAAEPATD
ncbi:MAG: CBS domain-containing protein [Candidatus Caldarchaeum sp.]|nr:CBS domain-containing protein [Candidatus Caldarchaeum sp.]MCX8200620.1 CBS domain-containing protein [Candidatus Caldarchaeum sp.]MDW8063848.1 CBS domain-containing protein [Candidatus Caldarchaeum sp.]MDW8435313.1 CBS domain-containing protein [Candidatus Caldarchaeum sp.]